MSLLPSIEVRRSYLPRRTSLTNLLRIALEIPTLQPLQFVGPTALFYVGGESALGPIALARLLVALAQRKALDTIQG